MKVLLVNTFDVLGGAARAATRLQTGLREQGIAAPLLVQFKTGRDKDVVCNAGPLRNLARRLKIFLGLLPVRRYPKRPENNFSPALLPDHLVPEVAGIAPDLVHLHWLGAGFLRVETLGSLARPLIWTLHDSWPFTGGCHVPYECRKYRERCGACPVLGSPRDEDLSRRTWNRKARAWADLDMTLVAPSRWLADCARSSSLFRDCRVEVIPNGLDCGIFRPRDRGEARTRLGLPQDRKIILFGAVKGTADPNKGFHLLRPALQSLGRDLPETMAVVFGSPDTEGTTDLGMPVSSLGRIEDDRQLAALYAAADVFVAPSIQEAFCQTAAEALACGTPVVAFGATGLLDVVEHRQCGYLAEPYDCEDLARGIAWVLEDDQRHAQLSQQARKKAEAEFGLELMAKRYITLYREVLGKRER